jgi:L-alanine-DL-glutamate epimerase-like enolase superfamily enzyme
MTITDVEFFLVEMPCDGRDLPIRSLVVRLTTDARMEGWGEAPLAWRPSELAARRDSLLPILAGRSVFDVEDLLALEVLQPSPLRCALEIASWDLIARAARQPLCHLFGGRYRQRVPMAVRLRGRDADELAQFSREMTEQGFHVQVLATSGDFKRDLDLLSAVANMGSDRTQLRFDAAGRYDMDTARDICRELEDLPLEFVLDPLGTADPSEIASLRRQTSVSLAVERIVRGPADVLTLVRCGAAQNVVVDLSRIAGLVPARKAATIAQAAGIGASFGGEPSLGIRTAAMLQLVASTPAYNNANECAYHELHDDLLVEPLEIIDGMLSVPQSPGLGIEVDRGKLEAYQVT